MELIEYLFEKLYWANTNTYSTRIISTSRVQFIDGILYVDSLARQVNLHFVALKECSQRTPSFRNRSESRTRNEAREKPQPQSRRVPQVRPHSRRWRSLLLTKSHFLHLIHYLRSLLWSVSAHSYVRKAEGSLYKEYYCTVHTVLMF